MAASPMATAVFNPFGSISTRFRAAPGTCFRTAAPCSAFVTVQMRSAGISGRSRATVCSSIVSLPAIFRSCLGVRVRLRGQNRVPRPPARTTACVSNFSLGIEKSFLIKNRFFDFFPRMILLETIAQGLQIRNVAPQQFRGFLRVYWQCAQTCGNQPAFTALVSCRAAVPGELAAARQNDVQIKVFVTRASLYLRHDFPALGGEMPASSQERFL